ncbi:MAG TPA: chemotaxis protein CheW [candidate division Zixibacteria bacterium]|nr:chemotaxis protein CheW [candidate division Zixibacteria bacterium]
MDIITFSVGDMRMGIPLSQVAPSSVLTQSTLQTNHTGAGTLNATMAIIDLRHKFCFSIPPGERDTRIIVVNLDNASVGLVINRTSDVSILQEVDVEAAPGTDHPYVTGMVMDRHEPVFLFDLDMVLSSDTMPNLNDLFSKPILDDLVSPKTLFLETAIQVAHGTEGLSIQHIRQLAETHDIPLSTASRLVNFHTENPASDT